MTGGADVYQHKHLIQIVNASNVYIYQNSLRQFTGDAVSIDMGFVSEGAPPYSNTRNNRNVWVIDNYIDGVDNNTRNGVSVLHGESVFIRNNIFVNIAKQLMPGSVDIEPNPYPHYLLRDIFVDGNSFTNCGGISHVTVALPENSYVSGSPHSNIQITGNMFTGLGDGIRWMNFANISVPTLIRNNVYSGANRPLVIGDTSAPVVMDGAIVSNNRFHCRNIAVNSVIGSGGAVLADTVRNSKFVGNQFTSSGGPGVFTGNLEDVTFDGNTFTGYIDACVYTGFYVEERHLLFRGVQWIGNTFQATGTGISVYHKSISNSLANTCSWRGNKNYSQSGTAGAQLCRFPASDFEDVYSASPTGGAYAVGAYVRNIAPASGQPIGWVCTVAGAPGTWVNTGILS